MVNLILIVNGIYDLLCACSILFFSHIPVVGLLSKLHPSMFSDMEDINNPIIRRLLAYWLATYGTVRLAAGCHPSCDLIIVATLTYFLEGICFEYECIIGQSMVPRKAKLVSVLSGILGLVCLLDVTNWNYKIFLFLT